MSEQTRRVFVDFNRRSDRPDTFVTWAAAFKGEPFSLGESVVMTDLEELELDGYVSWVSSDLKDVYVTRGASPVASMARQAVAIAPLNFGVMDIDVIVDMDLVA